MANQFIGEIQIFSFGFAPRNWAQCNGQLLPIAQNQALFSLLGTYYGGNGTTNFALPDLRSRTPIGMGSGPGLSPRAQGQSSGVEAVSLQSTQLPVHNHTANASAGAPAVGSPNNAAWAAGGAAAGYSAASDSAMAAGALAMSGGGQPHTNIQPYTTVNFCIALTGIFPSRN